MKKEVPRLLAKVDHLTKEGMYTQEDFGRSVNNKTAEAMSNFVATFVAKHEAELAKASVAAARLHDAQLVDAAASLEENILRKKTRTERMSSLQV